MWGMVKGGGGEEQGQGDTKRSVVTRTQVRPLRKDSMAACRAAWPWSAYSASMCSPSYFSSLPNAISTMNMCWNASHYVTSDRQRSPSSKACHLVTGPNRHLLPACMVAGSETLEF